MRDDPLPWPRQVWIAERGTADSGVVTGVLSEQATLTLFATDPDRDPAFHAYVDIDIHTSAVDYYRHENDVLRDRVERGGTDPLRGAGSGRPGTATDEDILRRRVAKAIRDRNRAHIQRSHPHLEFGQDHLTRDDLALADAAIRAMRDASR